MSALLRPKSAGWYLCAPAASSRTSLATMLAEAWLAAASIPRLAQTVPTAVEVSATRSLNATWMVRSVGRTF